ncbi:hypothetical protein [Sphaerisporangium aureirubrum]|uniref:Uncharacterized protein n=1 Tax=Sphaerisporangium aureirubrum TaxID=1544736 RepID=A0ABW1NE23_9ACTN
MSKTRTLLAAAALTAGLATAMAATPAQAATPTTTATTASATQAQADRHGFSRIYSGFDHDENRGDRSYFTGYWYSQNGYYHFNGNLFDRDRDNQYSYIDFQWHDDNGWHHKIYRGHRFGPSHFTGKFRKGTFDNFRIRVGEGTRDDYDWGSYRYFF